MERVARIETEFGDRSLLGRIVMWAAIRGALLSMGLLALVVVSHYVQTGVAWTRAEGGRLYEEARQRVTRVEVIRELVPATHAPLSELIGRAAKAHGLHPVVLEAIVKAESAGGGTRWLYRFEPRVFAAREKVDRNRSEDERRMLASSHGAMQVMGYNAEARCGVHWSKLYDPAVGIECGAKILAENLARHVGTKAPEERLWLALRDYNGSGPMAEAYADRTMGALGKRLFARLVQEER